MVVLRGGTHIDKTEAKWSARAGTYFGIRDARLLTPNCMASVHQPTLLSWRLEFFELLTQSRVDVLEPALSQYRQDTIGT